jgi:histidinol-phosphatase (PHP family)
VLTDYHVHLRRDDDYSVPADGPFTPANAERYREAAVERGIEELGVAEHVYRFAQALDVWTHPFWQGYARDDLDAYCEFVREQTDLKLGIEADFIPGREDRMASLLDARDWDYVVGSIHFLSDRALDVRGEWDVWRGGDPDKVWARYFETLGEAARTGMYDILAHPDLVKVWGVDAPRPEGDLRRFYEPAVTAIAESGIAVEISTAGLRKPVGEIYPAPELARLCAEAGVPFALSSDAHLPEHLGHAYDEAVELLRGLGVGEISVFEARRRRSVPLG